MATPLPLPPVTCCLPGFTYDSGQDKCVQNSDPTLLSDPVPCACCPLDWAYIDGLGRFILPDLSYGVITGPTPLDQWYNTCAQIVNTTWVNAPGPDPIACPCCPPGFKYFDEFNYCIEIVNPKHVVEPIPCVPCACTVPPTPVECVDCKPEGSVHTSFAVNPNQKQCDSCGKTVDTLTGCGKYNVFVGERLIRPYFPKVNNPITKNSSPSRP